MNELFKTVAKTKPIPKLYDETGDYDWSEIMDFVQITREDLASICEIKVDSVRFDARMTRMTREYLTKILCAIELVGEFFEGNEYKTKMWFQMENPLLGNITPRKMISWGRVEKLHTFIINCLNGEMA